MPARQAARDQNTTRGVRSARGRRGSRSRGMTEGLEVTAPAQGADSSGTELPNDSFVLESQGWSANADTCAPKIYALASLLNLESPQPVARVVYHSKGNALVIAGADEAR